jgi:hypothetical protein
MSLHGPKLIAGAVALAIAGGALANTSLNTTTGDVFLNIVNTNNNTSYLFDTGVSQATFNGNGSYSFNLSGDANLTSFLAETGGVFYYSVESATKVGTASIVYATGVTSPVSNSQFKTTTAETAINLFLANANSVTSSSSTSVLLPTAAQGSLGYWGVSTTEGTLSKNIFNNGATPYSDGAALNTALAFYAVQTTGTAFASTWDFSTTNDSLTYGPQGSAVPLPAPILLLASALGLMGVVSRRKKAVE